jgi:hypothetical protein
MLRVSLWFSLPALPALFGIALLACGSPARPEVRPVIGAPPAATAKSTATASGAPAPTPEMKSIAPTAMATELRQIGLDPAALPPLNKLDARTLRDVMNTFTKALGVKCTYCHEKDFKAPTPNKKITAHMWDDFTRALALDRDGALYCDSCHGGRARILDRQNVVVLGDYMQSNYVEPLRRVDKKEHSCETCHGEPFEGHIFQKLWK